MTIMDKDDKKIVVDKKQKKKKKKKHTLFYKLLSFLLIISTVVTTGLVIYNEIFTVFYMIPVILISIVILFIISYILNKDRLRAWIKNIFSIIAIIILIFELLLNLYGTKTLKFLSDVTDTGYRVESFGVYILNTSEFNKLKDLNNKTLNYLDHTDDTNIREALARIEKKISLETDYEESIEKLLNSLVKGEVSAILMDKTYESIIKEEFKDISPKLKLIETIDIVDTVEVIKSSADITKDPFVVYISGIDTSGNVGSKARSDVNLLMAINPKTRNILMVNTPRDYYVTLSSKGKKDKLTHAGIYGVEESLNTLADLYSTKIDYYARINFTSFIKIVDALNGIKVNVPASFCEQDSHRSFKEEDLICLNKGTQTLNGEQALALARHRHSFAGGDRTRGENQMKILEAIINKALSPKIITKYTSLISALEGRVTTNMTTDEMYKLAKKQIKVGNDWKFTSISAKGKDSRSVCYSTGSGRAYVMEPNEESLSVIIKALDNIENDVEDVLAGTEELTTTKATS